MPLRAHLREFRSRLIKAELAILVGAVVGWFVFNPLYNALIAPLIVIGHKYHVNVQPSFTGLTSGFNLKVSLAISLGLVLASPVWLYQGWAFLVPGLTRKERNYSLAFVGAAVPLFLAGVSVAWFALPNAADFLIGISPKAAFMLDPQGYLDFVTRLMLAFGAAFVAPLLLVALNMVGVLSGKALLKGWRIATFLSFLFAAVASPTPDAITMIALAIPIVALYFAAVGIALVNDRRRAKRDAAQGFGDLADDEASEAGD